MYSGVLTLRPARGSFSTSLLDGRRLWARVQTAARKAVGRRCGRSPKPVDGLWITLASCPQTVDRGVDDGAVSPASDARTGTNTESFLWIGERLAGISPVGHTSPGVDRQILALAVPALGALVAEPLFVLVDSAVVGHLGTAPLAGLALASTILITVIGLCVFLAYATTAAVARRLGSGDRTGALQLGVDGMWLALGLGAVLAAVTWLTAPWLVGALGASDEVATQAVTYLRWSAPGLPGMLLVLASTGALRGLLDTRTPLVVASVGALGQRDPQHRARLRRRHGHRRLGTRDRDHAGRDGHRPERRRRARRPPGRRGPATGRRRHPGQRPRRRSAASSAPCRCAWPSCSRSSSRRAWARCRSPAHQVVSAVWGLAAFALDALAIAAQALVGHALGASDVAPGPRPPAPDAAVGGRRGRRPRARARWAGLAVRAAVHPVGRRPAGRDRCPRRRRA